MGIPYKKKVRKFIFSSGKLLSAYAFKRIFAFEPTSEQNEPILALYVTDKENPLNILFFYAEILTA
jgi:hypothetical protein